MAHSNYLNSLSSDEYRELKSNLHEMQDGKCFICLREIDMDVEETDVDHIQPLANGGKDAPINFALVHSGCNKRKQDSDLRVAQVLEKMREIQERAGTRAATLADVLLALGGSKKDPQFKIEDDSFVVAFGDALKRSYPIFTDKLSGERTVFLEAPYEFVFHDELINPRGINTRNGGLIKEFHRGNPQLQVCLARLDDGRIKIFDGQHKTAAQLLLGQTGIVMRLFIDPDVQRLITTNTNAGSTLKQVAFDKSIMHQLSNTLYGERIERYQGDHGLSSDDFSFSESMLMSYFKGQANLLKYIIEAQKTQITRSPENRLTAYINFEGKGTELPLSYSSYDKAILSRFIDPKLVLGTPLNYREEEGLNPRQVERSQIIRFLNLLADIVYVDKYDPEIGTYRIEDRIAKGNDASITNEHLAAFRMSKEEILLAIIPYMIRVITYSLTFIGANYQERGLFMSEFPEQVWENLKRFIVNYASMPLWKSRPLAETVFSGKKGQNYWSAIFASGFAPDGMRVLDSPINIAAMISPS